MSAQDLVARTQKWSKEQPWRLYGSQISILVRNELRRNLFTRRRIWIYLLALIPALIILTHVILDRNQPAGPAQLESNTQVLAGIVQLYYFRLGIFFSCMAIFTWLFRGEMVERTLHYQFSVPVRRKVRVVESFLPARLLPSHSSKQPFLLASTSCIADLVRRANRMFLMGRALASWDPISW